MIVAHMHNKLVLKLGSIGKNGLLSMVITRSKSAGATQYKCFFTNAVGAASSWLS
jgi:hypothetical protein